MKLKVLIALLQSLGLAGVFGLAFLDSSLLSMGSNDIALILFVASKASWVWAFGSALVAASGSVLGARVTYGLSRKSGGELLRRRMPGKLRERVLGWTHRYGALPVGIAAVMPPPMPYAPFVISAGVVEVPRSRFTLSVAGGRGVRYLVEAYLAMVLGRHLVRHLDTLYWSALKGVVLALVVLAAAWFVYRFVRRLRQRAVAAAGVAAPAPAASALNSLDSSDGEVGDPD